MIFLFHLSFIQLNHENYHFHELSKALQVRSLQFFLMKDCNNQ